MVAAASAPQNTGVPSTTSTRTNLPPISSPSVSVPGRQQQAEAPVAIRLRHSDMLVMKGDAGESDSGARHDRVVGSGPSDDGIGWEAGRGRGQATVDSQRGRGRGEG